MYPQRIMKMVGPSKPKQTIDENGLSINVKITIYLHLADSGIVVLST